MNNIYNLDDLTTYKDYCKVLEQDFEILSNLFSECKERIAVGKPINKPMLEISKLLHKSRILNQQGYSFNLTIFELLSRANQVDFDVAHY